MAMVAVVVAMKRGVEAGAFVFVGHVLGFDYLPGRACAWTNCSLVLARVMLLRLSPLVMLNSLSLPRSYLHCSCLTLVRTHLLAGGAAVVVRWRWRRQVR